MKLLRLLALASLLAAPLAAAAASRQPNILLIFTDDLTNQAISAYNHPLKLLQTPNIDRLAQQGSCRAPRRAIGVRASIITITSFPALIPCGSTTAW